MKIAWIVYRDMDDFDDDIKIVMFEEPDRRNYYYKIIPIVYAEIENL